MTLTKSDWKQFETILDKKLDDKLTGFATKDDLKEFATKDDLKAFATKKDIANFATKTDIKNIAQSITDQIATKHDLKNLKSDLFKQFTPLPTKKEFFTAMDKWMQAASTNELEKAAHKHDHERIREFLSSCQA